MFRFAFLTVGCIFAQVALCQSFNVDLDVPFASPPEGGGGPSSTFGAAANQPGYWNAIYAAGPRVPVQIADVTGALSSVTLQATGILGSGGGNNFSANTGDFAYLLNDFADYSNGNTYTFSNLASGEYAIYSYVVDPSSVMRNVEVRVDGSIEGTRIVTGPMPGNSFIEGVTHSVHHVHLTGNSITITLITSSNLSLPGVNGFQIVAVPEPASILVCSLGVAALLRKKGK